MCDDDDDEETRGAIDTAMYERKDQPERKRIMLLVLLDVGCLWRCTKRYDEMRYDQL